MKYKSEKGPSYPICLTDPAQRNNSKTKFKLKRLCNLK